MQHDDARALAQRIDDPAVRVRVVADVVERDVGGGRPLARLGDDDLDALAQRRQEQRRVVGDPRARRRQRRVVGDLHERSASTQASQVTRSAIAWPAPPHAFASSTWSREVRARLRDLGGVGSDDEARSRGRARPRAGRRHRASSRPACPRGTPRTGPSRSPRRPARSRRRGNARRGRRARSSSTRPDELDLAVQPGGEPLEPLAVGPFAGDHDAQRRLAPRRLDQQVDALGAIEPVDREHEALRARRRGRRAPAAGAAEPRPRSR